MWCRTITSSSIQHLAHIVVVQCNGKSIEHNTTHFIQCLMNFHRYRKSYTVTFSTQTQPDCKKGGANMCMLSAQMYAFVTKIEHYLTYFCFHTGCTLLYVWLATAIHLNPLHGIMIIACNVSIRLVYSEDISSQNNGIHNYVVITMGSYRFLLHVRYTYIIIRT